MQMDPKFEAVVVVVVAAAVAAVEGAAVEGVVDFQIVVEQQPGHSNFLRHHFHNKIAENLRLGKHFHNTLHFLFAAEVASSHRVVEVVVEEGDL
jgi:hypothetical protein